MPKERRAYTQHPGVKLKQLKSGKWYARYRHPDTGRETQVSLDRLGKKNAKDRRDWCIAKSKELRSIRADAEAGIVRASSTPVDKAMESYYDLHAELLSAKTVEAYNQGTKPFVEWCRKSGLEAIELLTPAKLANYRDHLIKQPKGNGNAKGRWKRVKDKRSPAQVNKLLNGLRVALNALRKRGLMPELSSDSIRDSLEYLRLPKKLPEFLTVDEINELLDAAKRHDDECDDGMGHHHEPVRDFVYAALLTGMRFSELADLKWAYVTGWEIRLPHDAAKGQRGRIVSLRESPTMYYWLKDRPRSSEYVFSLTKMNGDDEVVTGFRRQVAESARKRLIRKYNAPKFTWHGLRRTTGTYLCCAPGIYGAASAFLSAKRLGHSVQVSERYYAGQLTGLHPKAQTLEEVMNLPLPKGYIPPSAEDVVV